MGQARRVNAAREASEPGVAPEVRRAALVMVTASSFGLPLMLGAVNVALPTVAATFSLSAVALSWVPLMFLLGSSASVLAFGRLADMVGRKRVFVWGSLALAVASLLITVAPNGQILIALRALQGLCAAMLYATQAAIVTSVFPPAQRGRALGYIASSVYFGLTLGPLVGGWLVEHVGWQAAFVVHLPLTAGVLLFALPRVPGDWAAAERGRFDWRGALNYAAGLACVVTATAAMHDAARWLLLALGLGLLVLFVRSQRRRAMPLFDVSLFFTNRTFALSSAAALLMYTTTFSILVLVSLHLQYLKGLPASQAGFVMFAQPLIVAVISPLVGRLSDRFEPRVIATAGAVITGLGLGALARVTEATTLSQITGCLVVTGIGFGLFATTNVNAIMGSIDRGQQGAASSAVATARVLGQLCSMGLVSLAFAGTLGGAQIVPAHYPQLEAALRLSFALAAALCVPCAWFSLVRGRLHAGR